MKNLIPKALRARRTQGAFTLIELLVVIAIIAILTALILPSLAGSKAKARDAQRVSDVSQLQLALELYYDRCQSYPSTLATGASNTLCSSLNPAVDLGTFISQIPTAPAGAASASYGYAILTNSSGANNAYVLHASLEGPNDAVTAKGYSGSLSGYTFTNSSFSCNVSSGSTDYCIAPQ